MTHETSKPDNVKFLWQVAAIVVAGFILTVGGSYAVMTREQAVFKTQLDFITERTKRLELGVDALGGSLNNTTLKLTELKGSLDTVKETLSRLERGKYQEPK